MTSGTTRALRGVNLGGWLVLERWMTPSLFEGTVAEDEFSLLQTPGAIERVERHRKEFVTEEDFKWLAEHGIDAVRIPVGYWIFDGDEPFTPCVSYLDWAFTMAEKYDMKILIDLHAAKGSQNGKDHSGRVGDADWFRARVYRQETTEVLQRLAGRYRDSPALWGIELLNEPALGPVRYVVLRWFYRQASRELAGILRPGVHIVFSDAFMPWLFSGVVKQVGDEPPVMAVHWYQFGKTEVDRYFAKLAGRPRDIEKLQRRQPIIVGEWSGMLSHQTLAGMPKEERARLEREHMRRQLVAYEGAMGWFYWTYKTEGKGVWNFRQQVEEGNLLLGSAPVVH